MYISPFFAIVSCLLFCGVVVWILYDKKTGPQRVRALVRKRLAILIGQRSFEPMTFNEICEAIGATDLEHRPVTFEEIIRLVDRGDLVVSMSPAPPKKYYGKP